MQVLDSRTTKVIPRSDELVHMDSFLRLLCVLNPYRQYECSITLVCRDKQEAKFRGVDRDESCLHFS